MKKGINCSVNCPTEIILNNDKEENIRLSSDSNENSANGEREREWERDTHFCSLKYFSLFLDIQKEIKR